jgi:hypothetical protein
VEHYIQTELIPEMVSAIRTQADTWGFPWYEEWANYRQGEGPKTLSVALTNGDTWFHGLAPSRGHAEISIRVEGAMAEYESLTDGIMSTFQHELFHNQQRNISLHFGGHDDMMVDDAWRPVRNCSTSFIRWTATISSNVPRGGVLT